MMNMDTHCLLWALLATPFVLVGGYITYLVVPEVVRVVVPAVVRAVIGA
jgi:hypothetical protein